MLPNSADLDVMALLDQHHCTSLNVSKVDGQYRATAYRKDCPKWGVGFGSTPSLAFKDLLNASSDSDP